MSAPPARALIAEDEPLLAAALQAELARAWPELQMAAIAGDGKSAVRLALEHQPDVLFFDIRMPGLSGLDAAAELADAWPVNAASKPFPLLVFVTAYDQYAVKAFETQAVDYVLKPVQSQRLQKTLSKLQQTLASRQETAHPLESTLAQLRSLLQSEPPAAPLQPLTVIQASTGNTVHMVRVDDVVYFESADKYVRVVTAGTEYLIRTPVKDLLAQLDPAIFWQVHRGTVVRATDIASVQRDEAGKLTLQLRSRTDKIPVSRLYAHLFRAM